MRFLPAVVLTLASSAVSFGTNILANAILGRSLGVAGFGEFTLFVATAGMLCAALDVTGSRHLHPVVLARDPALTAAAFLRGLGQAVTSATLVVLLLESPIGDRLLVWIGGPGQATGISGPIAVAVACLVVNAHISKIRVGLRQYREMSLAALTPAVCMLAGSSVLAGCGWLQFRATVWLWVGANFVACLVGTFAGTPLRFAGWSRSYPAAAAGVRAYLMQVLNLLGVRVALATVALSGDLGEVGLFSVALSLVETLNRVPAVVTQVAVPELARSSEELAGERTARLNRMTVLGSVVACILLALGGSPFIHAAFGDEFSRAYLILLALLPAALGRSIVMNLTALYTTQGFPWVLHVAAIIGVVCNVAAAYVLVPPLGGLGAAISMSIGCIAWSGTLVASAASSLQRPISDLLAFRRSDAALVMGRLKAMRRDRHPA